MKFVGHEGWAGVGDGVLFYDPDGTGEITEMRQYVFTEWDPTATSDMEALASVFDTDGDGELSGAELDDFRIMRATKMERLQNVIFGNG